MSCCRITADAAFTNSAGEYGFGKNDAPEELSQSAPPGRTPQNTCLRRQRTCAGTSREQETGIEKEATEDTRER